MNLTPYFKQTNGKFSNEKFLANAPDDIMAKEKAKLDEFTTQLATIAAIIARLKELDLIPSGFLVYNNLTKNPEDYAPPFRLY